MFPVHILTTAANAVVPIVALIFLGYWLRRIGWLTEDFVKIGHKLVFKLFLPCMLFVNVYNIERLADINWPIVLFSCLIVFLVFLISIPAAILTTPVPQRRGVLVQCIFRSNMALIGLPLAASLGGSSAESITSIISAFTVPLYNILAVIALSMFLEKPSLHGIRNVLSGIAKNPIIQSIVTALVCLALREMQFKLFGSSVFSFREDLPFLYSAINQLKSIATPFALLVMGGQFVFSAVRSLWREILVGTLGRIVVAPFLGISMAIILRKTGVLQVDTSVFPGLIALLGTPTAVSGAVMAGQTGNDQQLATQFVVWTSIGSIFTVFLTVCLLMSFGFLTV